MFFAFWDLEKSGERVGQASATSGKLWHLQFPHSRDVVFAVVSAPPQEHTGSGGPGPFSSHVASPKTLIYVLPYTTENHQGAKRTNNSFCGEKTCCGASEHNHSFRCLQQSSPSFFSSGITVWQSESSRKNLCVGTSFSFTASTRLWS